MKNLWRAFLVCFSMYSVIPMPQVEWKKENMKTVFCFFPLIGVLIGGASLGWYYLAAYLGWNCFVYAAVAATIPIFITGGIHMDGYIDTCDALFSYGDTDKKLEILKDPRVGAFGVMYTGVYFLLQFALFTEMKDHPENLILLASGYVVSRAISGIAIVSIKTAKSTGLASLFCGQAEKQNVRLVLSIILVLIFAAGLIFMTVPTIVGIVVLLGNTLIFCRLCKKQFGGMTGDLAGFYLQISEILILAVAALL